MDTKEKYEHNEGEIDLGRLCFAVLDRAWLVALVAVLCAAIAFSYTFFFITPQYRAGAVFYVNNTVTVGDASLSVNGSDLNTSRKLVDSYIVILRTRETLNAVIEHAGVDRSYGQVLGMISAASVNGTEMFRVTVSGPDPLETKKIADAIAHVLPGKISNTIDGSSTKIVEYAEVPTAPYAPNCRKNASMGFMIGLLLTAALIVLKEVFDTTIRSEDDIERICSYPILSQVPDMLNDGKKKGPFLTGKARSGKGSKRGGKKKQNAARARTSDQKKVPIGSSVSFAAAEAYKRLRTKLQFAFTDESSCRVIGLSSALSGEGKSLTAVNLAYNLAQLNKRVIILDCDMRRPTMAEKMRLRKKPGLSEFLSGQNELKDVVQSFGKGEGEVAFHAISAGENPPNPVEMLSSQRMERLLASLRKVYDYVVLDLPPVAEVTDAMAIAPKVDGMLMVVRQNYCDRIALKDTVQQFSFINAKILGVVFNCTSEYGGDYYGKGYYRSYYRRRYYSKGYGYNVEKNER